MYRKDRNDENIVLSCYLLKMVGGFLVEFFVSCSLRSHEIFVGVFGGGFCQPGWGFLVGVFVGIFGV